MSTFPSLYKKSRLYIYNLLHTHEIETSIEYYTRVFIVVLILLNILSVVLETVQEYQSDYEKMFYGFEVFSIIVFTIEYVLRLWSVVEDGKYKDSIRGRISYMFSFMAIIDLLAIFPFYLPGIISIDLRFIRGLRLFRLFRIVKLGRYSSSLGMIVDVVRKKRYEIAVTLLIIGIVLVMSSSIMFYIEHEAQPKAFPNIPVTLWWGVATLTTIGYGDVYPITTAGRICASIISILGIGLFALPSGILVAGFIEELEARTKPKFCPHCGKELEK